MIAESNSTNCLLGKVRNRNSMFKTFKAEVKITTKVIIVDGTRSESLTSRQALIMTAMITTKKRRLGIQTSVWTRTTKSNIQPEK